MFFSSGPTVTNVEEASNPPSVPLSLAGDRPHVAAILPRGEAIRNFVYTGALDHVARTADVSVLSVIPSPDIERLLRDRFARVQPLESIPERHAVGTAREVLDLAHGRWLWSEVAQTRWRVRDWEVRSPRMWLKRNAKKFAAYPFANRPGLRVLSRLERTLSRRLRTTETYVDLFRRMRPTLVFNGSHVHGNIAIQPVQAAQWLGIPTATFIFSWDNLTSQGRIVPSYDFYLVWSDQLRDQLLAIYEDTIRPEQVFVTGTPQFDFHFQREYYWSREQFCAHVGADPHRPIVVYTTGMPLPQLGEPELIEGIGRRLREMTAYGPPQLLVRVYPKDRTGRFEDARRRNPDILFPPVPWEPAWMTPRPEDASVLINTLRHAAVGINAASTVSLELCMFERPVINVAYNPPGVDVSPWDYRAFYRYEHYQPVAESGALMLAWDESEIPALVARALDHPRADVDAQRALLAKMFGSTLDGRSAERVADRLASLAVRPPAGRRSLA
jgi:hypothetical protein